MAQPVIVQDATLRQFAGSLRSAFSVPQWKYFVTVLVGLLHCDAAHTLSGLLRQAAIAMSVSGLSRFLKSPAWSAEALMVVRQERFNAQDDLQRSIHDYCAPLLKTSSFALLT